MVEFNQEYKVTSLEEKPKTLNQIMQPLDYISMTIMHLIMRLNLDLPKGELEITDLNKTYLNENKLNVNLLGRGFTWLDTGTPQSMFEASTFINIIETKQGIKIACLEEIAYKKGWINDKDMLSFINQGSGPYLEYLKRLLMNKFNWDALKFSISKISDKRGDLYFFEALKETLTFNFNRIYFVKNNFSSYDRGFHAHHRTQQAGLVIQGS